MRKLFALFHNEMIKIFSKAVTWILIALMIFSQFGIGAFLKLVEKIDFTTFMDDSVSDYIATQKENLKDLEAEELKLKYLADAEDDPTEKLETLNDLAQTQAKIYVNKFATEHNMAIDYYTNYISNCFETLTQLKSVEYLYDLSSDLLNEELGNNILLKAYMGNIFGMISDTKSKSSEYEKIIINGDYKKYIELSNEEIYKNDSKTQEEKDIDVYCNELRLKLDPSGIAKNWEFEATIQSISNSKLSLLHGVNYVFDANMNAPLTEDEKIQIENLLAVNIYKVEHGIITADQESGGIGSYMIIFNMGLMFVIILTMVLAGSSISQEIATGSIKSLIISPVKRWKIFTAKLLSILVTSFAAIILLYLASSVSSLIFLDKSESAPYVFAVNGTAKEIGFFVYRFLQAMVSYIDVVVYLLLALMLSTVTRNTALSVAAPIGVYFGSSIAVAISTLIKNDLVVKFIPFTNLNLTDKFFPFTNYESLYGECLKHPLSFSLVYVGVMCLCMLVTAMDSFNRRDLT
ncbi:MAG: ABC transporter permease [Clostridiales bacterium]|nr:ABC transporter permease [Clostridiales bacterium]